MSFGIKSVLGGAAGVFSPTTVLGTVGLGFGDSLLNNYQNKKAASAQNRYTYGLIDYENEYNLPVNQRARLEEAGYNPNLALSGLNVQSATGSAPSVQPTKFDMANMLLKSYNLEEQNNLLRAQADETKAREALIQKQISNYEVDHQPEWLQVANFLAEALSGKTYSKASDIAKDLRQEIGSTIPFSGIYSKAESNAYFDSLNTRNSLWYKKFYKPHKDGTLAKYMLID